MNRAQTIPVNSSSGVVTFDILSEGQAIDPAFQVYSITVEHTANRIPVAHLMLRDGEASEGEFAVSDTATFEPGKAIEIKAGYDGTNESIFKGVVVKQRVRVFENGDSMLAVECRHPAFKSALARRNRYFSESKDSDAISEVLGAYGLQGDVEATTITHQEIVQYHSTDWDFTVMRAEANGLLVLGREDKIDIKAPQVAGSPDLQLAFGGNLLAFDAEVDARHQWSKVIANSWDAGSQELNENSTSSISFSENGNLTGKKLSDVAGLSEFPLLHGGWMPADELKTWTEAEMLKSRLAKIRGRARFIDFTPLQLGQTIELQGVGARFNGNVYLTGVRYELVDGNCFCDIQFGLSPQWHCQEFPVTEVPAAGLLPAVNGLQVGKVTKLEGDPEGLERIQVNLPRVLPNGDGVWARLATLDAGAERGMVFRPEIDDEVIVGFLNDDPRDAVVLGHLHSSANPAPIPASDDNHIKGYTSREQMKVEFDDEKKVLTVLTPAGNEIVLSEDEQSITIKDQNDNSMVMDSAGITIKSPKDIKIEATGKIELKATQDLKAEGLNVEAKAQVGFKAEGSATAELSSGGQTTVKGGILMLN